MPAGHPSPEGPTPGPIVRSPEEMKNVGTIKELLLRINELEDERTELRANLKTERQQTASLAAKASSFERDYYVLRERLGCSGHRDTIEALIIVVIIAVLTFAVDFARYGNWRSCAVLAILTVILLGVIYLLRRGYRPTEGK